MEPQSSADRVFLAVLGSSRTCAAIREAGFETFSIESEEARLWTHSGVAARMAVIDAEGREQARIIHAIQHFRRFAPLTDVLVCAPGASSDLVREAMQHGAKDVVLDLQPTVLRDAIEAVLKSQVFLPKLQEMSSHRMRGSRFGAMLSRSNAMWDLFESCTRVALSTASVLIVGETGTGKELLARSIHHHSGRAGKFVALNCASVPPQLVETELFGNEQGAFTGAHRARKGLFRHADRGTLFLDEIGDMPMEAQVSLLRALQQRSIRPVGGWDEVPVDVRIVAASQKSLEEAVEQRTFREDLLYRVDVVRLVVPPLRERPEDIVYLFGYFLRQLAKHYRVERPAIDPSFLDELTAFEWPGNVRQLENFTERLVLAAGKKRAMAADARRLLRSAMGSSCRTDGISPARSASVPAASDAGIDLRGTLAEHIAPIVEAKERAYLTAALQANAGRIENTAQVAGITRRTLLRKLTQYGLDKNDFKPAR